MENHTEQPTSIADQQPVEERRSIGCFLYVLWAGVAIAGIMAGYLLGIDSPYCQSYYEGETWTYVTCFSLPVILVVGVALGALVGLLAHRALRQVVHHYVAILIATICIPIIGTVVGYAMVSLGCWSLQGG